VTVTNPAPATNTTSTNTVFAPPTVGSLVSEAISILPAAFVKGIANVVSAGHKEAAFVMGVLAAFGVVPTVNKTTDQLGAVLLLAYSAITHVAEKFGSKS
jgi:hypothetical protein